VASHKFDFVSKGKIGESYATKFLIEKGFKILDKNFRSRFGEIDIIAERNNELYFCEVKTRWNTKFGLPQDAVTKSKLDKIIKTIDYYLYINKIKNEKLKIIVISQMFIEGKLEKQEIIAVN